MITELHIGTFTGTLFPQHPVLGGGVFPDGALVSVASEARGSSTEPIEAGPLPEGRSTLALLFSTLTCSVSLCARHSKYTLKLDHKFILSFRTEANHLLPQMARIGRTMTREYSSHEPTPPQASDRRSPSFGSEGKFRVLQIKPRQPRHKEWLPVYIWERSAKGTKSSLEKCHLVIANLVTTFPVVLRQSTDRRHLSLVCAKIPTQPINFSHTSQPNRPIGPLD